MNTWKYDLTGEFGFVLAAEEDPDVRPIRPGGGNPSPLKGEIWA
jgi:hypothetical protein